MTLDTGWREPTSLVPLRFGRYQARYLVALCLLFAGGILVQFTSAYTFLATILGIAASVAGWLILPSAGWRRLVAAAPAVLGVAALLTGAQSGVLLALTLAGWLLVRMRPLASYLVLVLPVTAAVLLGLVFTQYGSGVLVGSVLGAALVAAAWLARVIAASALGEHRNRAQPKSSKPPLK